jgi:hypothetical protein
MNDYRAAPEQWTDCEQWAINGGAWDACIIELRARVEALEAAIIGKEVPLVELVHSCIVGEPACGHMQARAAIREVAAWLREHAGGTRACWLLDVEAKQ